MTAVITERDEDFARLTEPFRGELLAHCYRMLGSVHDAEDQVQETLLRAWRSYGQFENRAALRTWLYRIATNACLRALENRRRRPLPSGLGAPASSAQDALAGELPGVAWLEPFPDVLLGAETADPGAIVAARAGLRLALIAALQHLPPRQRAVLILRDVLGWRAAEVAGMLGVSTVAVNSALQRARAHLAQAAPAESDIREPADPGDRDLVARYATAFQDADIAGLTRLLAGDVVFEMPPQPAWLAGRAEVGAFLAGRVLGRPGGFRLIPAPANGQPAFAMYLRDPGEVHRAHAIQVLTLAGGRVGRIVSFRDPGLFPAFGLPETLLGS